MSSRVTAISRTAGPTCTIPVGQPSGEIALEIAERMADRIEWVRQRIMLVVCGTITWLVMISCVMWRSGRITITAKSREQQRRAVIGIDRLRIRGGEQIDKPADEQIKPRFEHTHRQRDQDQHPQPAAHRAQIMPGEGAHPVGRRLLPVKGARKGRCGARRAPAWSFSCCLRRRRSATINRRALAPDT